MLLKVENIKTLRNIKFRYYSKQEKFDNTTKKNDEENHDSDKKKKLSLQLLLSKMQVDSPASLDISKLKRSKDELKLVPQASKQKDKDLLSDLLDLNEAKRLSTQDLISQMVVQQHDKRSFNVELLPFQQSQRSRKSFHKSRKQHTESISIFHIEPLHVFNLGDTKQIVEHLDIWSSFQQTELQLFVLHPPLNYFSTIIALTKKREVWKFPIDNEQSMVKRENFSEHIFLDKLLSWCEKKGPVRKFMDLVVLGLSQNPYLTIAEKKEHVVFYKRYFKCKATKLETNFN